MIDRNDRGLFERRPQRRKEQGLQRSNREQPAEQHQQDDHPAANSAVSGQNLENERRQSGESQCHHHMETIHTDKPVLPNGEQEEQSPKAEKAAPDLAMSCLAIKSSETMKDDQTQEGGRPKKSAHAYHVGSLEGHAGIVTLDDRERIGEE